MRIIIEKDCYDQVRYVLINTTGILKFLLKIWVYIKKPIKVICLMKGHNLYVTKKEVEIGTWDSHTCLRCGYSKAKNMKLIYMPRIKQTVDV